LLILFFITVISSACLFGVLVSIIKRIKENKDTSIPTIIGVILSGVIMYGILQLCGK
jgi:hypothetical protein